MADLTFEGTLSADPDCCHRLLTDAGFLEESARQEHAVRQRAGVTGTADRRHVVLTWTVPTEGIPVQFRRFVGPTLEFTETAEWTPATPAGYRAEVGVDIVAARHGELRGEATLAAAGGATRYRLTAQIRIDLPLVGGLAAGQAAGFVRQVLSRRVELANRWIADGWCDRPAAT